MSSRSVSRRPAGDATAAPSGPRPAGRADARPEDRDAPRPILLRVVDVVGGFGLAVVVLLLLTVLVFAGTLEQKSMSLFEVQQKYFDSLFVMVPVGPLSVPLPGATLLLAVLFVNLVVGGVIRIRKRRSTVGILVAHLGILVLLLGGFVETLWSDKGFLDVWEGESSSSFKSYYEWEIAVTRRPLAGGAEGSTVREYVLDPDVLRGLDSGDAARFSHADLPFDVVVSGWVRNAQPKPARDEGERAAAVEGWLFEDLGSSMSAENETPGAIVTLVSRSGAPAERSLLWGYVRVPWAVQRGDSVYELDLRRRSWPLPFSLHLKKFTKRDHPGTGMAAEYSSDVTRIENGVARDVHISMNEPLRHKGYTFYQSNFNPQNDPNPPRWQSVFSVVRNPADRVPIAACAVIALGLCWHFVGKLRRHLAATVVPAPKPAEVRP